MDKPRIFLIDGMGYIFRAYFAIRGLTNSQGMATNAVFGFARALLRILNEQKPTHIAMIFDAPGKTFREDMYPDYKGHRPDTPQDLIAQFPLIDELVEAFRMPVIRIPGVEADDVIGTLARQADAQGIETVIASSDKDLLQLVSEHVKVFDAYKGDNGAWYDAEAVKERYGVEPARVIDVLALMGDAADNVPGVRGIGEKTARKLLEQFHSLDGIYAAVETLKGKQKEKLIEDKDLAYLSRELVTIKTDVPLDVTFDALLTPEPDRDALADFFRRMEFRTLAEEFLPAADEVEETDYRLILTRPELDALIAAIEKAGACAVDTETTSTLPMEAELVGISISVAENTGAYIPVGHLPSAMVVKTDAPDDLFSGQAVSGLSKAEAIEALRPVLENPAIRKVGHNIKYDIIVLARAGIALQGVAMDTMIASYLTDPSRLRHNLNDVSLHYLRRKLIPISDLIGKGSKATTFDAVPVDKACIYASEDADISWRLSKVFQPMLKERGLEELHETVELPLMHVLARMEMAGVAIDKAVFNSLQKEIESRLAQLEGEIHDMAGGTFSINSPKQLQEILFSQLGLKPIKRTKTGYSTDMDVLEQLAHEHPLPEKILEFRTLEKLRGTYIEALPKLVNRETGRIHTSYNQAVAATGRLSSSDPNLQNIPVRTEYGRRIREGFVSGAPNLRLISADYSQIELRILAHLAGDEHLKNAFFGGADIHRETAARVFGVEPENVTPDMRRQAKAVNFGVVYGISAFGLARGLGISNAEAKHFIDTYFAKYPGVRDWIEATLAAARTQGYVTTLLNRRRYIPEINSSDVNMRKQAERIVMNTPVQGSAADIIKLAMIRLDDRLHPLGARQLMQVHDELVVEGPAENAEAVAEVMRDVMENALNLTVPLKVDVGIGENWAAIH